MRELREEIIKMYAAMILAAQEANSLDAMGGYLLTIFEFIEKLVQLEGYSDVKCAKNIVGLVGDIASVF